MSTIFVAMQCCQCDTMQVKQQKKSSNKWTCVICNQKQSVRKVFARGFQAKDVRKFVQDFNMSRQIADAGLCVSSDCEEKMPRGDESVERNEKRTDWREYLDDQNKENDDPNSDGEIQIVTEPPREMFKRARLRANFPSSNSTNCVKSTAGGSKLLKPTFAKRKGNQNVIQRKESEDTKKCRRVTAQNASKWSDYLDEEGKEKCRRVTAQNASKWSEYLDEEGKEILDEDKDSPNPCGPHNEEYSPLSCGFREERVEEDVHPDFL